MNTRRLLFGTAFWLCFCLPSVAQFSKACPHCGLLAFWRSTTDYNVHTSNCSASRNTPSYRSFVPQGPSAEEIAQSEARELNQKAITAYDNGDYDAAVRYMEQALQKWPDNATMQNNLRIAQNRVAEKKAEAERTRAQAEAERKAAADAKAKFERDKRDALISLKGISKTDDSGLKGITSSGLQLKGLESSSGLNQLKGVEDFNTRNKSPDNFGLKDLRDAPNSKSTGKSPSTAGEQLKSAAALNGNTRPVFDEGKVPYAGGLAPFESGGIKDIRTPIDLAKVSDRLKNRPDFKALIEKRAGAEARRKEFDEQLEQVKAAMEKPGADKQKLVMQRVELKNKADQAQKEQSETEKTMRYLISLDEEDTTPPAKTGADSTSKETKTSR